MEQQVRETCHVRWVDQHKVNHNCWGHPVGHDGPHQCACGAKHDGD